MAWNMFAVVPYDQDNGPLYPTAAKGGRGVTPFDGETIIEAHSFATIQVSRKAGVVWSIPLSSDGNKGQMFITSHRVVFVFDKVPRNRSMFTPVPAAQSVAGIGKHRGEGCVGHIRYEWIAALAARKRSLGMPGAIGALRLLVTDGTEQERCSVLIEVQKDKAPQIASQIALPLFRQRTERPAAETDEATLAMWRKAAQAPFDAPPKEFKISSFEPAVVVRS